MQPFNIWPILISALLGWLFGAYNANRTAKRSDVRHACDRIENTLNSIVSLSEDFFIERSGDPEFFEERAAQQVGLLEMRHKQVKNRLNRDFISGAMLAELRALLTSESLDDEVVTGHQKVNLIAAKCWDILEQVEHSFTDSYIPSIWDRVANFLDSHTNKISTMLLIVLSLAVLSMFWWLFSSPPKSWLL